MIRRQKYFSQLRWLLLIVFFCVLPSINAQSDSIYTELPRALQNAYKTRTAIIKNDTIVYRHRWFIPGQYKIQYAGSIGFMSIGFGYTLSPTYQPSLYFGYLNKEFGNSENSVFTVSLKNSFYLTREPLFKYFKPYLGMSINWGHTHNTFDKLPDYYPKKYYFQNKIHFAPFLGGELKFGLNNRYFNGFGIYSELSAMDAYLLEAIRTDYVKWHMSLSLAVGVTFYLR